MSRKRKTYSADFKAKVVLELLEDDKTLNETDSKYRTFKKSNKLEKTVFIKCFISISRKVC